MTKTANAFENERNQAEKLKKGIRFATDEVAVRRLGASSILTPRDKLWESFLRGINGFSDDFMSEGRVETPAERDNIKAP